MTKPLSSRGGSKFKIVIFSKVQEILSQNFQCEGQSSHKTFEHILNKFKEGQAEHYEKAGRLAWNDPFTKGEKSGVFALPLKTEQSYLCINSITLTTPTKYSILKII